LVILPGRFAFREKPSALDRVGNRGVGRRIPRNP